MSEKEKKDSLVSDIVGGIIFIVIVLSITIYSVIKNGADKEIEYARAGLQQCRIDNDIVWQKDCELSKERRLVIKGGL